MKKYFVLHIILASLFTWGCQKNDQDKNNVLETPWLISAPAGNRITQITEGGESIIPNGRIIAPKGNTYRIAPHPYGLTLSPDGSVAITANSGTGPFSISLLKNVFTDSVDVSQIPEGYQNDENLLESVFMGLVVSPDNRKVYVAGGQSNKVFIFSLEDASKLGEIDCGDGEYKHGYIGDMILSKDGSTLYAVDQIGFRLVIIDVKSGSVKQSVKVGRYPFGIALSPDESKLYVANVGMFEYSPVGGLNLDSMKETTLSYPAYAYNSKEAREGIDTDSLQIPALGDPNVKESFSVWTVSLENEPKVISKIKTGILVGEMVEGIPAVGGASPNSLVATDNYVFVSNGNNDCISVIDIKADTLLQQLFLTPDERLGHLRGIIPFGLGLSPDKKRLYVAESGINAVGVVDVPSMKVIGHIPAGWFPSKLKVSPDGKKLVVANAKGYGSGPNGGKDFEVGPEGSNIGKLMKGSVSILNIPTDEELNDLTQHVIENNFTFYKPSDSLKGRKNPVPLYPGEKESPIKYIVFISKENRTYDEIFGQLKKGNGDSTLARYGLDQSFYNRDSSRSVDHADVMVNHLKLTHRFAISDNFYVDSDHSADGHRWLVNTYPNEWVETSVSAAYGGKRGMRIDSKAPGNLALVGSSGAIYPEDYNEHGSIWDHFDRNAIDFYNFGFGVELAGSYSDSTLKYMGVKYAVNFPVPAPMFDKTSKKYPTFNMAIPDQFRADVYIEEFNEKWSSDTSDMPAVITLILPQDHGSSERPSAGYPFRESYMADNDLALGRIVEFLSHTRYWNNMAIIVTEDDSQNGLDHIDAHRSLLMVYSPYAKKDYVSKIHYSFGSIFKTFWNILGIPYLNQYDAGATDLSDFFTNEPDYTPYNAVMVDKRVFDPEKALDPFDEDFDWKAVVNSPELDDPDYLENESDLYDKQHRK